MAKKAAKTSATRDHVVGALSAMTKRLQAGEHPFSEAECRLFVALLQVENNRALLNDADLLAEWGERFQTIENWISARQTREALQVSTRRQRRPPGVAPGPGIPFTDGNP